MIDFHYVPTGNNLKIAIALEELELPYRLLKYDMYAGTHQTPEFRQINPNSKLPAIVDHDPADGGEPLPVFESGAILLYLAEKTGRCCLPDGVRVRRRGNGWFGRWPGSAQCSGRPIISCATRQTGRTTAWTVPA